MERRTAGKAILSPRQISVRSGATSRGIRDVERVYFEYLIENEPLLQAAVGSLMDGDAYPTDYVGKGSAVHPNSAQISWGRIVREISQTTTFQPLEDGLVEASVVTSFEGALKISAPYHLSRRKRHAVLYKPFRETCVQKVFFRRVGNFTDPEKAWKLVAVSVGKGGTETSEVDIEAVQVRGTDEIGYQIRVPLVQTFSLNGSGVTAPLLATERETDVEVQLRSKEMEQSIVVLRAAFDDTEVRTQLLFRADAQQDAQFIQTYSGTCIVGKGRGYRSLVVEAVQRSSLFETGGSVCTSYWLFPVSIQ
jgi:hypothetical protein